MGILLDNYLASLPFFIWSECITKPTKTREAKHTALFLHSQFPDLILFCEDLLSCNLAVLRKGSSNSLVRKIGHFEFETGQGLTPVILGINLQAEGLNLADNEPQWSDLVKFLSPALQSKALEFWEDSELISSASPYLKRDELQLNAAFRRNLHAAMTRNEFKDVRKLITANENEGQPRTDFDENDTLDYTYTDGQSYIAREDKPKYNTQQPKKRKKLSPLKKAPKGVVTTTLADPLYSTLVDLQTHPDWMTNVFEFPKNLLKALRDAPITGIQDNVDKGEYSALQRKIDYMVKNSMIDELVAEVVELD